METYKPIVSVVIISLNHAEFVYETIDPIITQTYSPLEIIVMDGGSTDGTVAKLAKYPTVRVISEKDDGPIDALTKGLHYSRGDYVLFQLMSDGLTDTEWISKCVDQLTADTTLSLCWGHVQLLRSNGEIEPHAIKYWRKRNPRDIEFGILDWLIYGVGFHETNMIMRRSIAERIFSDFHKLARGDDIFHYFPDAFHKIGYLAKFIPSFASFSRVHSGQLSSRELTSGIRNSYATKHRRRIGEMRRKILFSNYDHEFIDRSGSVVETLRLSISSRIWLALSILNAQSRYTFWEVVNWITTLIRIVILKVSTVRVNRQT